jgi:translation elongation factor EF-Tu-like GTPase
MALRLPACAILLAVLASSAQGATTVTLVGDEHLGVVMREMAGREGSEIQSHGGVYELAVESAGVTLRSLVDGQGVTAMADLLLTSDIALIVVDATRGPTPVIREHILIARQARVPMMAMLLGNVEGLFAGAPDEAPEVLALEIREIRDLLSAYDMDGNAARVYLDSRPPDAVAGVAAYGSRETLLALAHFVPRRVRAADLGRVSNIWGAVYLLTDTEADGNASALAPNDSVVLWSEGTQSTATLNSVSVYHPGDFREMPLSMEVPVKGLEGSRFLLVNDDRVIGVGAITQIVQ